MKEKEQLINYLSQFISEERYNRIFEVSGNRTHHVAIIVENLYQSHNMSAVLRTAECLGVQNVHIIENNFEYKVSKEVSMGADKWLSMYRYHDKENNTEACLQVVKAAGYKIVATMPAEHDCLLDDIDITEPKAFLFGTELLGLTPQAIAMADEFVKIPMYGFTESYNISVSVALTMMNVVQRLHHSDIHWQLSPEELLDLRLSWIKKSIKDVESIIERYKQSY